jgi:hypothetical protein
MESGGCSRHLRSTGPKRPVSTGRNEEKWFRRKQNAAHPGKADLLASRTTALRGKE